MKEDTRTEEEKEQARQRRLANLKPFKPLAELTEEERNKQMTICRNGWEKSSISHTKRASMNELAKALLNQTVTREQAQKILGDDQQLITDEEHLTVAQVLNVAMVQESLKGNVRAYEAIRDTAGFSPKQQLEITADIMTDADRLLLSRLESRLSTRESTG